MAHRKVGKYLRGRGTHRFHVNLTTRDIHFLNDHGHYFGNNVSRAIRTGISLLREKLRTGSDPELVFKINPEK